MLTHLVLGAHIILLYFLERALRNTSAQLSRSALYPRRAGAQRAARRRGASARGRRRSAAAARQGGVRSDGFVRPAEWEPLTADELRVIEQISAWLGPEARRLPYDTLVTRRGYRRVDGPRRGAYLDRCSSGGGRWTARASSTRRRPTARMERYCAAGPIGFDADGHVVEYQGIGNCPPDELLQHFTRRSSSATRATRASACGCTRAPTRRRGRRLYKVVSVLDLAGFGMGHMKILNLLKTYNALFAALPRVIAKFVVINAPLPFTAAWRVIKSFMHPITVQKVHIAARTTSRTSPTLASSCRRGRRRPPPARQRLARRARRAARAPRPRRSHAAGRVRRPPTSPSCASSACRPPMSKVFVILAPSFIQRPQSTRQRIADPKPLTPHCNHSVPTVKNMTHQTLSMRWAARAAKGKMVEEAPRSAARWRARQRRARRRRRPRRRRRV